MKAMGIDLGQARVGLALADDLGMMAHPLETITVKKVPDLAGYIAGVVSREKVGTVVLGLPRNMDGSHGPAAAKTKEFGEKLKGKMAKMGEVKLVYWDERMTSVAAQRALHDAGRDVKKSRPVIDQVAAQMILQGYLDALALRGESARESFDETCG
jgi:putative holliday junction resolvase